MEQYLKECKVKLENANDNKKILIVLGNEACDLDSAVSSIVFAFLKHKTLNSYDVILPVLNVKRNNLRLHSEVEFFLQSTCISLDDLICKDEINIKVFADEGRLDVALVDHNVLSVEDSYLEPNVVIIVDHHAVGNSSYPQNHSFKVEPVGSCCTLIAEEIFAVQPSLLDPQIAMLLYGTILLDTICLNESLAKRVTEKDKDMVLKLEAELDGISRQEVFETLQKIKFNVKGFSPEELLQKDLKMVSFNSSTIAIASIPSLLEDMLNDNSMRPALVQFCSDRQLEATILLGSQISKDQILLRRQIAVFALNPRILEQLSDFLTRLEEPSLDLSLLSVNAESVVAYEQGNISLTRKFVLPAVSNFLSTDRSSGNVKKSYLTNQNARPEHLDLDQISTPLDSMDTSDIETVDYQAETLDFPDSPNHTNLLKISLQMQESKNEEILNSAFEPQKSSEMQAAECKKDGESLCGYRKKISVHPDILRSDVTDDDQKSLSSLSNKSDMDVFSPNDDIVIPDDMDTPEELENSEGSVGLQSSTSEPIPEISAAEEYEEERSWKSCIVGGEERKIDMKVIEPYKKVLSHGGYHGATRNAIIIFCACYLPDRSRKDYDYVMDNLFLYVLTTLDQLVAEDYVLVYLHGATERGNMPSFGWLKRCYQMIDRRLRKNLKGLYLVHPTFWLKTIVIMTKPFISSKFSRKLKFVDSLEELSSLIPMDHVCIPDKVKKFDDERFVDS